MDVQLELSQKPFIELQIEALINTNRIKPKRVNKFIDELEKRLVGIKDHDITDLSNKRFRIPMLTRPNSMNDDYPEKFKFIPPQGINVIGGFRTLTAIKKGTYVDLAICLPPECLNKSKDIKNHRYHLKRALYLAQLAYLLNGPIGSQIIERLEFRYHQGDFLKPVLVITPKDEKLKNRITFQMFVYPGEGSFKLSLLQPSHGNIAPKWFFKDYPFDDSKLQDLEDFLGGDSDMVESPFYNSSILFDLELVYHSDLLFEQIGTQATVIEALILTKIWLYQRELHNHFSFILSIYIAYLQTQQLIHQNMSSYQIFKIVIKSIASSNWTEGLSYFEDFNEKLPIFKKYFSVVFLSPSGCSNLCHNITLDLYNRLKHEAQIAQNLLSSSQTDVFELLFLRRLNFINKFDLIAHLPKCTRKLPMKLDFLKRYMDYGVLSPRIYSENVLRLLERALTDRVILIQQNTEHILQDRRWNHKSIPYDPSNEDSTFTLGLLLDPEKSIRIIDIGPEAQTEEAEEFRKFWEPKSQLRLQNGIISETVVWHIDNFCQRRSIIKYIFDHVLKKVGLKDVVVHHTVLERFISLQNSNFEWNQGTNNEEEINGNKRKRDNDKKPIGVGEEVFQKVLHSYNNLAKVIRNIDGLNYSITSIQPVSPHLRGSSVFPPLPVSLQQRNKNLKRSKGVCLFPADFNQAGKILHIEPVEILLTLESSAKWPNELDALEAAKLEYLIQLGEALKEKEYSVKFSEDRLEVLVGQFVFRIRIKCAKQLTMIAASCGKHEFQKKRLELELMPRVHAALDQLYRGKPAFGLTCRLVKRWLACHLLTDHISEIALELIIAHLFIHPQPYSEPASSLCGFGRFLALMSSCDWKRLPLVVNFDDQLKIDEVNKLKDSMLNERSNFSPIVIITPYDKDTSPWTKSEPTYPKLDLIVRICARGLQFFNKEILSNFDVVDQCKALFRPNFKIFDIIIKLHPQIIQNFFMSIDSPKNFELKGKEPPQSSVSAFKVMPIVGLNVVEQYVNLLRSNFDNVALFFYDKFGQRVIGVVLKPESEKVLDGDLGKFMKSMKKMGSKLVESISLTKSITCTTEIG